MGVFTSNTPLPEPLSAPKSRSTRLAVVPRSPAAHRVSSSTTITGAALPAPVPQRTPEKSSPFRAVRSLTAAARPIDLRSPKEVAKLARRRQGDSWQDEAWEYYDAIGEIKYAFTLVSSVMSRIRLYAGEITDPSQAPKPADAATPGGGAAISALARLDSAFGGQPGLLRDAALNLSVVGECYLVQQPGNAVLKIPESWDIRSTDELQVDAAGNLTLITRSGAGQDDKVKLPKSAFVTRIWRPHPRYSDEPESSMRGVLDSCADVMLLNRSMRATARSRLNAGLLYVPDGLSVAASPDPEIIPDDSGDVESPVPALMPVDTQDVAEDDDFEEQLLDAMTTPIADEESAAAVVPLLVRGPADLADKLKLLKFERSFDPHLVQRADKTMERILAGLDLPKDVVNGLAGVKYSNAVVIEESLLRSHIEPLCLLICDALTVGYLRPALKAMGVDETEAEKFVIWYDPSDVIAKPNRAEDATEGYDKSLLSGETWRKEHGFTKEDAPTPTEIAIRLLLDKAAMTPELTESLLMIIAPEVAAQLRAANQAASPAPLPPEVAQAIGAADADAGAAAPEAPTDAPPGGAVTPPSPPSAAPTPQAPPAATPPGGGTPIDAEDLV